MGRRPWPGLMSLDTIVRADGTPVTGVDDLIRLLNGERIGRPHCHRRFAARLAAQLRGDPARAAGSARRLIARLLPYCGFGAACLPAFFRAGGS